MKHWSAGPSGYVSATALAIHARIMEERRRHRRQTLALSAVAAAAVFAAAVVAEVDLQQLAAGLPRLTRYIGRTLPDLSLATLAEDLAAWMWALPRWLGLIGDTVLIAFLATVFGGLGGLALSFLAARNTARHRLEGFVVRRLLDALRTVPDLVFALVFVYAFGVGAMPGVFAIALHTAGTIGKLATDVHEGADPRPIEALTAAGARWSQVMRWGVLPQGLPTLVSYLLLRFEINVRSAAVVGFVGAGGIGQELSFVIRQFIYQDVSALIVVLALTVMVIDSVSGRIRRHMITGTAGSNQ